MPAPGAAIDAQRRRVSLPGMSGEAATRAARGVCRGALLLFSSLVACSRDPSAVEAGRQKPPGAAAQPSASPAIAAPLPSAGERALPLERLEAELQLPRLESGQRAPLLLVLHGLGGSAQAIEQHTDLIAFARQQGIAWLAPNGPLDRQGRRFWDAGPSCCNFDHLELDHVAALSDLLERNLQHPGIDRGRVYAVGYSNGGFMAHRLGCERPDLLRGIVSFAGAGPLEAPSCRPPQALRVLQVHGDADTIVTYAGGHLFKNPRLPRHASAQQTSADWAVRLGCGVGPQKALALDLEAKLPGSETEVRRFTGCTRGAIELWTIVGGSHYIGFRSKTLEAMWNFLQR